MDIWRWVHETSHELWQSGHERLATLIDQLPGRVLEGHHADVDAMVPEALGLARALQLPWVEVFVRHWHLQSRVSLRHEGEVALSDAVLALDLAHTDGTRGCPQSICTVQDLAMCYGRADGPGWAAERLAVVEEATETITPAWPCWRCLAAERAGALLDSGDPVAALGALDDAAAAAGGNQSEYETIIKRLDALIALGRFDEAIRAAQHFVSTYRPRHVPKTVSVEVRHAQALVRQQRFDEANDTLPDATALQREDYAPWADVIRTLVAGAARANDGGLGATLRRMLDDLVAAGSWFSAAQVALVHGDLAVARGRGWVARQAARDLSDIVARLRQPGSLPEAAHALRVRADVLVGEDDGADIEALLARFEDDGSAGTAIDDIEAEIDRWEDAYRRTADDRVAAGFAMVLLRTGHRRHAVDVLDRHVAARPVASPASHLLIELTLEDGDDVAVEALARRLQVDAEQFSALLLARHSHRRGRWGDCARHCRRVVELEPSAMGTRRLWADAARRDGDLVTAFDLLSEVVTATGEIGDRWGRILVATLLERWDVVWEDCAHLDISLATNEGPIEEEWHPAVIRYPTDEVIALRTGPASARVLTVALPGRPQRFGDRIVFDPRLLDPPPDDDDDGAWLPVYEHVADVAQRNAEGFPFAAIDLDAATRERIDKAVVSHGGGVWCYSNDDYTLRSPIDGSERPGLYAMIGIDAAVAGDVHDALTQVARDSGLVCAWPELAAAGGTPEEAAAHEELFEALVDD